MYGTNLCCNWTTTSRLFLLFYGFYYTMSEYSTDVTKLASFKTIHLGYKIPDAGKMVLKFYIDLHKTR